MMWNCLLFIIHLLLEIQRRKMAIQYKKINRHIKIAVVSLLSLGLLGTFSSIQT